VSVYLPVCQSIYVSECVRETGAQAHSQTEGQV